VSLPPPSPSHHPVDVGARTEALVRRGYRFVLPFGVNQRYDLILDVNNRFVRVQCKTGRLREGCIHFPARSTRSNSGRVIHRNYRGEVDLFLVHCPETGRNYAVPVADVGCNTTSLRVTPPANGQRKRIRWARDYELPA
jgi:PD-(D/E)XK endonuclease